MHCIAVGDYDAAYFVKEKEDLHAVDDCCFYVFTLVKGSIFVTNDMIEFLRGEKINDYQPEDFLSEDFGPEDFGPEDFDPDDFFFDFDADFFADFFAVFLPPPDLSDFLSSLSESVSLGVQAAVKTITRTSRAANRILVFFAIIILLINLCVGCAYLTLYQIHPKKTMDGKWKQWTGNVIKLQHISHITND